MATRAFRWMSLGVVLSLMTALGVPMASQASSPPPPATELHSSPSGATEALGLPLPYLSDPDAADAPFGNAPIIDGAIAPGEYAGAGRLSFPTYGGAAEVFFRQDAARLFVAFDFPDAQTPDSAAQVFVDTLYDRATLPQPDDYRLTMVQNGMVMESRGTGAGWSAIAPSGWMALATVTPTGWQAEFGIDFAKLGLASGSPRTIGLSLINAWTPTWDHYWPAGAFWETPSSWGHLVSSSDWGTLYWKPGPWEDYAPSGVPDFDMMQAAPTFAGPFAAANSLWWFDSKFERNPVGPVGATLPISDSTTLLRPYGAWDDHDPANVLPFALDLGAYFQTDKAQPGTSIYDMYSGIQRYLRDRGVWDEYVVTLVDHPEFFWIAEEVLRCEDVVLLLGFWQQGLGEEWQRIAGHYVTVSGVDIAHLAIALSDPWLDVAGLTGAGRVLSGALIPHSPAPHKPLEHNDAGNVSHDVYQVLSGSPSPGGSWWLPEYEPSAELLALPPGANPNPRWHEPGVPWNGERVHVEIEYALAVSPYTWKASGRWVPDATPLYGRSFVPFNDFAPSGMPDFDQVQDTWGHTDPYGAWQWTLCGPAAAANSLWWFDSKFETAAATPPALAGSYPLIQPYGAWDDHDPLNVDNPGTPWPPPGWPGVIPPILPGQGELVEELALHMKTDQMTSGTDVMDLSLGIETYMVQHGLRHGYVITREHAPSFWWVAEEVERSEDVILLLGFWQLQTTSIPEAWVRLGGHYVTLAGVDKQGGYVGFSDPWFDRMERALPPNEHLGFPLWTGRVGSDGDSPLGPTGLLPAYAHAIPHLVGPQILHNDAANVSHDVYWARVPGTGGAWGPANYVQSWSEIENFWGQTLNYDVPKPTSDPIETAVEWAVAVSPVADVTVGKTVAPVPVAPGGWVTFTLHFANHGALTAEDVVLSDLLASGLIHPTVVGMWTSSGLPVTLRPGAAFTWDLPDLAWEDHGVITIRAQVDPALVWPPSCTFANTVTIETSSVQQYQEPQLPDSATASVTVLAPRGVAVWPHSAQATGSPGSTVTYTLVVSNTGVVADTIALSAVKPVSWTVTFSANPLALSAGSSQPMHVAVGIPGSAELYSVGVITVTASSLADPTVSDEAVLLTEVRGSAGVFVYLPLTLRNLAAP